MGATLKHLTFCASLVTCSAPHGQQSAARTSGNPLCRRRMVLKLWRTTMQEPKITYGNVPGPEDASGQTPTEIAAEKRFRSVAVWVLLVMMVIICGSVFIGFARSAKIEEFWIPIAKEHFSAIVGLPMAALAALCIVLVLRISSGPLEFEGWGLKFKGAAAPVVFWLLCFLAMAGAIKLLW